MTKQVWKFPISVDMDISMPKGAEILSVQTQRGIATLWALVDPNAIQLPVRIHVAGTGHPLPDNIGRFIGTFQMEDGHLVFHVFELQS